MSNFEVNVTDAETAQAELSELRSGRGGRTSKYDDLYDAIKETVTDGKALKTSMPKNDVQGLRAYLKRHDGDTYTVSSARIDDDGEQYAVFVRLTPPQDADDDSDAEEDAS